MRNFQNIFETRKRTFISAFSIYMAVPLTRNSRHRHLCISIVIDIDIGIGL